MERQMLDIFQIYIQKHKFIIIHQELALHLVLNF